MKRYLVSRKEALPSTFSVAEREAYKWLRDCGVKLWLVDLLTHKVTTPTQTYANLVEFRRVIEASADARAGEGEK